MIILSSSSHAIFTLHHQLINCSPVGCVDISATTVLRCPLIYQISFKIDNVFLLDAFIPVYYSLFFG